MCCRQGIDKAPKPPKEPSASRRLLTLVTGTKNSMDSKKIQCGWKAGVERMDLTSRQKSEESTRIQPKNVRDIKQLHESVTEGRLTAALLPNALSMENSNKNESRISGLNKPTTPTKADDDALPNNNEDWFGETSSASASIGQRQDEDKSLPPCRSSDYGRNWPDSLLPSSVLLQQKKTNDGTIPNRDLLEKSEPSEFNEDYSDVEAVMVGLDDSIVLYDVSQGQSMDNSSDTRQRRIDGQEHPRGDIHFSPFSANTTIEVRTSANDNDRSRHEIMFLSTDSPERPPLPPMKRQASVTPEVGRTSQVLPVLKRQKINEVHDDKSYQTVACSEHEKEKVATTIKPGQPAWVYDFDPAFIVEWQDIVDFI